NTIPAIDKLNEIRTFIEFREAIMEQISVINDGLANGSDYVSQMEATKASGMKALNDRTTQAIEEITTLVGTSTQEITELKENTITEIDEKATQIKNDVEELNQYDTSNWQKYKLTNDNGTVISLPVGTDMNELKAGMYESSGFINDPLNDTGFYEVTVTESYNSRKVIYATHSYSNRMFVKTFHSGGSERDWKEITGDNTRTWLGTLGDEGNQYTSVLQLPPGYYECTIPSDAFSVDAPQDPNGGSYIAEIDVYEGSNGRKQYKLISNYNNNEYRATVHTSNQDNPNGVFRGWKRVMDSQEFEGMNNDTGWIEWNTINGATKDRK